MVKEQGFTSLLLILEYIIINYTLIYMYTHTHTHTHYITRQKGGDHIY